MSMDYNRLVQIDDEIKIAEEQIFQLEGGYASDIILSKLTFEHCISPSCETNGWKKQTLGFKIIRKNLIENIRNGIKELKKEKYKILNKKWYKFWI